MAARIHSLLQGTSADGGRKLGVVGASFFSMLTRMAQVLLQFLTVVILARFLTPSDFGLYGMVTPLVAFFLVMRDAGLGMATLQSVALSERQASTLFYANVLVGVGLSALFFLSAGLVAAFYGEARLADLVSALSVMFLFSGMRVQLEALVYRDRRFRAGLIMELIGSSTALCISSGIALAGFGYWALCARQLAYEITYTSALLLYVGWLPRSFSMDRQTFSLFKFGIQAVLSNFLVFFLRNVDNVLIGWSLGAAALGPYALGYRTVLLPIQQVVTPLARVFIPHLSQQQGNQRQFAVSYGHALRAMMFFVAPPLCAAWICAGEAIDVLLGPQWKAAVPIVQWLIPAGVLQVAYLSAGWLNFARGRADRQLRWGLLSAPVIVGGFVVGLHWGVVGVAASYPITNALLLAPLFLYAIRGTSITLSTIAQALAPAGFAAAAVSLLAMWLRSSLAAHQMPEAVILLIVVAATALTMLLLSPMVFGWSTLLGLMSGMLRRAEARR
ncbi:MAG TPA: lipopolysaccharide biosynthesis protein [Dongiaceae bacterium]